MINNKAFAIFTFFAGILCFVFCVATANGWKPALPTAQAAVESVAVIPQDMPQSIDVDGEIAPQKIQLPEVIIVATRTPKVNPGTARRRQSQVQPEESKPLESPMGLASDAALNYQPMAAGYAGHGVRGPAMRQPGASFSQPIRSMHRERETMEFEAK
jgi:hypothetical protein